MIPRAAEYGMTGPVAVVGLLVLVALLVGGYFLFRKPVNEKIKEVREEGGQALQKARDKMDRNS